MTPQNRIPIKSVESVEKQNNFISHEMAIKFGKTMMNFLYFNIINFLI